MIAMWHLQDLKGRVIFWFTKTVVRLYCYLFVDLRVHGYCNVPRDTGAIVVANHRSKLDGFLLYSLMDRMIYSFIKSDYFRNPVLRWYLTGGGGIPVKKGEFRPSSVRAAKTALKKGDILLIFPEGQVNEGEQLLPFGSSFVKLSLKYSVPVIPVTIIGTDQALPDGKWFPSPSRVDVIVKDPIMFHSSRQGDNSIECCVEQVRTVILDTFKRFELMRHPQVAASAQS